MNEKLKKHLPAIEKAAHFFNRYFVNKEVIYSTHNQAISVIFQASNFMHLCGIKYADGADKFFNACLAKKIDINKITIKTDGTTILKLSVLGSIEQLIGPQIALTEHAVYFNLRFDKALRTKKQIFALALHTKNQSQYIPVSFLNLKSIKNFPNGKSVVSIKAIHLQTREEITYL